MESQDVKVGRINDLEGSLFFDQAALLLQLQALSEDLKEQTAASKEQNDRLEKVEKQQSKIFKELVAIREILTRPRSTDPNSESGDSG